MIIDNELLSKIRHHFSLNLYEAKIWTALLSRGVSSAGELSDIGNVPRSRAYDILESLEKKGFIMMKLGKPIKYIAIEPTQVVERVKKLVGENAQNHIKKIDSLKGGDVLGELDMLHKQGIEFIEASDLSGAFRGRHNIYTHLELMIKGAKKNVDLATTEKGFQRKLEILKPELLRLSKKGVKIRIAAPVTKDSMPKDLAGIEIKNLNKLNARFCIVDSKEIMFMALDDNNVHPSYDIGIWVKTPYFASAMTNMFDLAWQNTEKAGK